MSIHSHWMVAIASTMVMCWTTSVRADPMTVSYDVHVFQVFQQSPSDEGYQRLDKDFTLLLTYGAAGPEVYGSPKFSAVPLPVPQPAPGTTLTTIAFTYHGQLINDDFFPLVAETTRSEFGFDHQRTVELFGLLFDGDVDPRTFTIET